MTEEEMAKEWIKEHSGLVGSYKFVKYDYESMQQAFLAGLKAQTKWHKVADGDLPDDKKIVLFYTAYFDFWIGGIEPKNDKKHRWEVLPSVSGDYYAEDEVIAWCEIPKYTEE